MSVRESFWFLPGLVAVLLFGDAIQAETLNPDSNLPTRRLLRPHGLERVWWNQAVMNSRRDEIRHLSVDEELTYVQSSGGMVSAFDNATGKRVWAVLLGRRNQPSFRAVSNTELVLVALTIKLYAIDKWSGEIEWTLDLKKAPSTSPEVDDAQVYVGSLDGSVYAYDLERIRELHSENRLPDWAFEARTWRYQTGERITVPAISNGQVVNFASQDRSLYSIRAQGRDLNFQFETNAPVSAPMARVGGSIYLASEDLNLYCIDAESGQVRWEFTAGLPIRQAPRIIGEHVFLVPSGGGIYCLNATTGTQLWWQPEITKFLASSRSRVYGSDEMGNVVVLSRQNGAVLGALPLRRFSFRLANDRTDRIVLASPRGLLTSIREEGREFPIYHMHPERKPILPEFAPEGDDQSGGASTP